MIKPRWTIFVLVSSVSWIAGCSAESASPRACSVEVATAELDSIHDDLVLQRLLRDQQVNNRPVESHIATRMLKHVLVLRATAVDVPLLKGMSLETLCLLTTDAVRADLAKSDHDEMLELAIDYLDAIEPEVKAEVSRIQRTMLGTGCSLSP